MKTFQFAIFFYVINYSFCGKEEEEGVKYANKCEGKGHTQNQLEN